MLFPPVCYVLVPCVVLVLTWLVSTLSAWRPAIELPRVRKRSTKDLRRSRLPERLILHLFLHSATTVGRICLLPPWLAALRKRSKLYVVWTTMAGFMRSRKIRITRLPPACFVTNYIHIIVWANLLAGLQGSGLCTSQRLHTEGDEQACRVGCTNEPDSSLITTNALSCRIFCLFVGTCNCASTEKPSSP